MEKLAETSEYNTVPPGHLVHLARLADIDLQVLADEREQCRREVNLGAKVSINL